MRWPAMDDPFAALEKARLYDARAVLSANPEIAKLAVLRLDLAGRRRISLDHSQERQWPKPLAPQAFHGIAGEIVHTIEPHTEADPAALLLQLLCAFGSLVGRGPHVVADGSRHGTNLFVAVVGVSSKGRKGTAWKHVRRVLEPVDSDWATKRIQSGLSSGEGLIWAVRDPIERREPIREKKRIVGYDTVLEDHGVSDKRLLVIESELSATLRVMARDGSTLSTTVRQAWDTGELRVLTKNSPAQATGAHISIIGHITRDDLRYLTSTDAANGFANRFLWICARRSKELPEGGNIHNVDFAPLISRVAQSVEAAQNRGELGRENDARKIWNAVYGPLSEAKPGLFGCVVGRSEAQVLRLALLYALLDGAAAISALHLQAALAVWDYCEASTQFVFGNSVGNPHADRILVALRSSPDGLTRTQIRDLLGRNQSDMAIQAALNALEEYGLAHRTSQQTGGRPTERWLAGVHGTTITT